MRWFNALLLLIMMAVLAACGGGSSPTPAADATPDAIGLLTTAANNIRASQTFRLDVQHSGADYNITILLNDVETVVAFRRAQAQYVAPDQLQATVRVLAQGILPVDVDVYSHGFDQWVRFVGTSWIPEQFASGFNPQTLIDEDDGFQAALLSLTELQYNGITTLEDRTSAYHLSGRADGPSVTALLVGMIRAEDTVDVDVYINRETGYPARLVIRQPETTSPTERIPTTWTVDVYDIDAPSQLTPPSQN